VLAPAYHHGSEIEALLRTGVECRFYDCGDRLEPRPDELDALLGPRVRALFIIHYLGFPQDAMRWRRWCDERGLLLIEDAAQAWLSTTDEGPVGSFGDLAVFCLYKSVGVPEGAAVICRQPVADPGTHRGVGASELLRRHGSWLAQRSRPFAAVAEPLRRTPPAYSAERDVALGDPDKAPWPSVHFLAGRLADAGVAARRRANYAALLDALADRVPAPFDAVPDGASPFVFPLVTDRKTETIDRLTRRGLRALDFWSAPHPSLDSEAFPNAAARRASIVGLPVHQELRPRDLDDVAAAVGNGRPGRPPIHFERLADLDTAREDWTLLAERSGNIFGTWEWSTVWMRHFGQDQPLLLAAYREDGGRRTAIVPLYLSSNRGLRILRFVGGGPADQLGPVCDPADRAKAARTLRWALERPEVSWDVFLAETLPAQDGWTATIGGVVRRRESSPVLDIAGLTWESFLASRSANLRGQLRRRERRLAREHELSFRLTEDPERLDHDLDTLFRLHDARWAGRGGSALTARDRSFHRDFARLALDRGWLRLWIMEVGGEPVAAWCGFRFAGIESYYQSGRQPDWDSYSVGFVLLAHSIREAIRDGMHEYRLLRGGERYKSRFSSRDPGLETVAVAHGVRGTAALGAAAAARSLPAGVRSALQAALNGHRASTSSAAQLERESTSS
jgi:CelD/BcsL family acetyltransferase involved in cellulose biosynthesis